MINRLRKVKSYSEFLSCINHDETLLKANITNLFFDEQKINALLINDFLQILVLEKVFFLLKKENGFYKVFFNAFDFLALSEGLNLLNKMASDEILQLEIVGKQKNLDELLPLFKQIGFFKYSSMVRMSKIKEQIGNISELNFLSIDSVNDIKKLFDTYFDKYVEQIPNLEELTALICDKNIVFVSEDKTTIQGFLISETKGFTSHLRYWFVHPDHRNKKVGSTLIKYFLALGEKVKRQILWVIETNNNAIDKYEHYGFKKEDVFNIIITNKNLEYDRKNH